MSRRSSSAMSARSPSIAHSAISIKMRNFAMQGKPVIDISLNGETGSHGSYVTSVSTMDKLEGEVSVTAPRDTRFDDIEIAFVGQSTTYVDKFASAPTMSSRSDATHQFLKLRQPIDESTLPMPRIAEAGRTYRFPFTFVIPAHLLPRSCQRYGNDQVRAAHLQLPPSLGDTSIAGHCGKLLDDLAPEMARISYAIKVTVTRERETDAKVVTLVDKIKKVRVKPAFEEQPPLVVGSNDSEYRLRQEKNVRKGIFKGKLGRLVMETQQPRSLCIPGARIPVNGPITTSAKVALRFDPADENSLPPRLGSLSSKLRVTTYFATTPRRQFPSHEHVMLDMSQGTFTDTLPLSSRCMAGAQWTKHTPTAAEIAAASDPAISRRDSGISDCSAVSTGKNIPEPSASYVAGRPYYTANLLIPIELPANKTFLPTFHSCLISRVYRLDLSLSVSTTSSISLKVPVQISAESSTEGASESASRAASQSLQSEMDAAMNEVFAPRSVAPPSAEFLEGSQRMQAIGNAAPPGYEAADFAGMQTRGVETVISVMS
ncbi:arrestin domain-containing protein [Diplodia corticola]|uniref:Arrestin domain-containing protein n=1 Tax=Diplodia corticola TaxID=236234 RepID=A0A1J9R6I7_9PEZI|nr:arrestin domain-containing protein [Diplodia corticola]OJD35834.1 arrestin domain-containing protein [Diplodia corticola]